MAYQTGTYAGSTDLLNKLRTFATSNGWTQNGYTSDGSGFRLHLQKGALYFNLKSTTADFNMFSESASPFETTGIAINGSTGYSAGSNWDQQPGSIDSASGKGGWTGQMKTSTAVYHLHANPDGITLFVETEVQYGQMFFGEMSKGNPVYAAAVGYNRNGLAVSEYNFLTYSRYLNMSIYRNGEWINNDIATKSVVPPMYGDNNTSLVVPLIEDSEHQFRGNVLLLTSHTFVSAGDIETTRPYTYVGEISSIKCLNVSESNDGDLVVYGSDEYIISRVLPNNTDFGVAALK